MKTINWKRIVAIVAVAVFVTATVPFAQAATEHHSFASDNNDDGPTFQSVVADNPDSLLDAALSGAGGGVDPTGVIIDLVAGDGEVIIPDVLFEFSAEVVSYSNLEIDPTDWIHVWKLKGSYRFIDVDANGDPVTGDENTSLIYKVDFKNAKLKTNSTAGNEFGLSGGINADVDVDPTLSLSEGDQYDVWLGDLPVVLESFSFTLTDVNLLVGGSGGPTIQEQTLGNLDQDYTTEASYSAVVNEVPEPTTMALLGVGAIAALRRRRR